MPVDRDTRLQEWERRAQPYLFIASILFLTSYTVRVLIPGLSPGWGALWETVTIVSWAAFVAEYLARLVYSRDHWHFVRTRWLDLIVTVLPLLRPLLMIDLHERMQLRRAAPGLALEARVMTYSGLAALLLGYAASLAVYHDERSAPDANIRTFGDAVWWAASTLTTTGYGDATPVTPRGRVIAVGLMFVGVALVGAVVGSFSAYLMRRFRQEGER
ncbi:potassium channel protein [Streptomyces platensis]|uniref:PH-gated potassium channel KcsA n=1 Tax=Streptomyces platensis TaxID=58346 RepID=A0AAE6NF69_STRPT|nr:potassium channel family protein [Streptomyces platensis]OSY44337.1 pH-gated potassium channel KcsA [Streptomyces platensis]QEV51493.1 potassium channel protein [Streptomyces platensis]